MKRPTLEEVKARAAEIDLPAREAEKFFNHFDSKGWKVGKAPMQRWRGALANWKMNWEEWGQSKAQQNGVSPTTLAILRQKELEEVSAKMKSLRASYSEHQSWAPEDKDRWFKLKARKDELKKLLGIQV